MLDLLIFGSGFALGMLFLHYIRLAFYTEKSKMLADLHSEVSFLINKLNHIADLVKLRVSS